MTDRIIDRVVDSNRTQTFLLSYEHEGQQWGFEIAARDYADAHSRLQAIRLSGKVDGILMGRIPAMPGAKWLVGLICWWNNLRRRP